MRRADLAVDQVVRAGATEGLSSLMVEEMRGVFATEMDKLIPALAPACWPPHTVVRTVTPWTLAQVGRSLSAAVTLWGTILPQVT